MQPQSAGGQAVTTPTTLDIGADVILQLLITKNYARLLSEPTLVTLSGKEASFLVGQEVPIVQQLPQSFTVEFKEVGVRMNIKPTADSQNQITTVLHAEVSQVIGAGAFGIPIIGSKKADTTLQVKDGQTVVVGGLLENNINRDALRKVPWLADIPLFGYLFRNKQFQQAQREVLFFMTPEIVKDVDATTAGATTTPLMRKWNGTEADEKLLKVSPVDKLWPEVHKKSSAEKTRPEKPAPAVKPAASKPAPPAPKPQQLNARWLYHPQLLLRQLRSLLRKSQLQQRRRRKSRRRTFHRLGLRGNDVKIRRRRACEESPAGAM